MVLLSWVLGGAFAADPAVERLRLQEEMLKLAQRNTWNGVDRTYRQLVELATPLSPRDHGLGAQAAFAAGDTLLAFHRLRRVVEPIEAADPLDVDAWKAAVRDLEVVETRFGLVSISVADGALPVLYRDAMPFAAQERDAILAAQKALTSTRSFRGLLPIGGYAVDALKFEVVAAAGWQVITVGE